VKKAFLMLMIIILSGCVSNKNTRNFDFIYKVELDPSNGKKIEMWLPLPQSNEVQTISDLSISTDNLSYEIKDEKKHGNKYLYIFDLNGINESKTVTVSFNVERDERGMTQFSDINPDDYLVSSTMVPVGSVFDSVIEDNNLNKYDLRGLYDFVLAGMHYGKPRSDEDVYYTEWLSSNQEYGMKKVSRERVLKLYQNAKKINGKYTFGNGNSIYACDIGVGNCTDYHSYFMSLSRSMDIPTRFHMGFPIPDGDKGIVGGYHCWADYYVNGEGWYPVDISEADKVPEKVDYFFGTVDQNRVEMMVGRDFTLDEYENNPLNLFIYPVLEIDDKESKMFKNFFNYTSK